MASATEVTRVVHPETFERLPGGVDEAERPRWEAFRTAYHLSQEFSEPQRFPLQVDFELNSTCQMRCANCTHGRERVPKVLLPADLFRRVIDEGAEHGLCSIKLNYINEPLLRSDLPDFIEYAKSRKVLNVYFATNGLLLTRKVASSLIETRLSKVMISLDAVTPRTFRVMRNSDELPLIEDNIYSLLALRRERGVSFPAVRVNFLVTPQNQHERDAFREKWDGVVDSIGFQIPNQLPGEPDIGSAYLPSRGSTFRCPFPFRLLVVDHAGSILPCCTFSGRLMPLGNVRNMTLADAWASRQAGALRSLHHRALGMTNGICATCIGSPT